MQELYDVYTISDAFELIGLITDEPRSEWCDLLMPFIKSIGKDYLEISVDKENSYCFPDMRHFSEHYKGKFNIGDYVTHTKYGGVYRIVELEALDTRKHISDVDWKNNIYRAKYIWEYGNSYIVFGIDDKGLISGTEIYRYNIKAGKDILVQDSRESDFKLLSKNKIDKNLKEKVNKFIYSFGYKPEDVIKQLKSTE